MKPAKYDEQAEVLASIKAKLPQLEALLQDYQSENGYENFVYRFYHQSFKVYWYQETMQETLVLFREILPKGKKFCPYFEEIVNAGVGIEFDQSHNQNWTVHARPIVEAYLHLKYFLEMAVKYGKALDEPPSPMPYGYAALMELFGVF